MLKKTFILLTLFVTQISYAGDLVVDKDKSFFIVTTHKGGIASAFAHDHVIEASQYNIKAHVQSGDFSKSRFSFETNTQDLEVDLPSSQNKVTDLLQKLQLRDGVFTPLKEKDRADIKKNMLDKDQLDAKTFTKISANLNSIRPLSSKKGSLEFTHQADVSLEIHGVQIKRNALVKMTEQGSEVQFIALVESSFSDFGIKPFSGLLGAVKNRDPFEILVSLVAKQQ